MTAGRVRSAARSHPPSRRPVVRRGLGVLASVLLVGGVGAGPGLVPAQAGTPPITPDSTPASTVPRAGASAGTEARTTRASARRDTQRQTRRATTPVTVTVRSITPSTPATPTNATARRPLSFGLTVTNTGDTTIRDARVLAFRGDPIGSQAALDSSFADTSAPTADGVPIAATRAARVTLAPGEAGTVVFDTTSGLATGPGLCQCANAIYPIVFTVRADAGTGEDLGTTRTWVPSLYKKVTSTRVSWVWPLIDRPHRLRSDTVFTDDDLVAAVSSGGRLDRALQVLEDVAAADDTVPVTIVADPELLDELAVMASGSYTVRTAAGTTSAGTGKDAALAWLQRFTSLLGSDAALQISLTPFADPDVQTLSRNGLEWSPGLPGEMAARVETVLGGREPLSDIAWPAGGGLGPGTLSTLVTYGVTTVLLDSPGITPNTGDDDRPIAVSTLRSVGTRVTAAVVSNQLRTTTAAAVGPDDGGAADLPKLVSEVAVRAIETGDAPSYAVLAPGRYVDPDPDRAARAILDTSVSPFATAVPLRSLADERPKALSKLRVPSGAVSLPGPNLSVADDVTKAVPALTSLIGASQTDANQAEALLESLPIAVQRLTSSAWRPIADPPFNTTVGTRLATALSRQVSSLLDSVRIVVPQSGTGTYTLGSDESRLPITVENTSDFTVQVRVQVKAQDDLPGYSTTQDIGPQVIAPNSKLTVRVPSRLDRSGRIPLEAQLLTPNGTPVGDEVQLYVRGTVFGVVGVVITVVAGAVLVLALLVRFARRVRRKRRQAAKRRTAATAPAVPVGSGKHAAPDEDPGTGGGP